MVKNNFSKIYEGHSNLSKIYEGHSNLSKTYEGATIIYLAPSYMAAVSECCCHRNSYLSYLCPQDIAQINDPFCANKIGETGFNSKKSVLANLKKFRIFWEGLDFMDDKKRYVRTGNNTLSFQYL